MPMFGDHSASYDLGVLKEAEEIKKSPQRMAAIQSSAAEKKELADRLTVKKPNPENDMATKGFTVLPG